MTNVKRVFTIDEKPFYPLGCESLYLAGYSVRKEAETEAAFKAVKDAKCNTAMIDIYWNQLNPKEGEYDFTTSTRWLPAPAIGPQNRMTGNR